MTSKTTGLKPDEYEILIFCLFPSAFTAAFRPGGMVEAQP
jgi:hypothetical protein